MLSIIVAMNPQSKTHDQTLWRHDTNARSRWSRRYRLRGRHRQNKSARLRQTDALAQIDSTLGKPLAPQNQRLLTTRT